MRLRRGLPGMLLGCLGCMPSPVLELRPEPTPAVLSDAFSAAITDAAVYRPENVRKLYAIGPSVDSTNVVAWTPRRYRDSYPEGRAVKLNRAGGWVTQEPEVRDSCSSFTQGERFRRLQELLGLPPDTVSRVFVVMRVRTLDIFRPCANPDPSAQSCDERVPEPADPVYALWVERQMLLSYRLPDGYPWTRLGYTYDWRPGASRYGASEYVIRRGASVRVLANIETDGYCTTTKLPNGSDK